MPDADLRRCREGGIYTVLVIEVLWSDDHDLFLLVVYLACVGKEIILTGEASSEVQPRIGEDEVEILTGGRVQQRVAAFVEHTTIIHDKGTQETVRRTCDALGVA